jgi:hypothetical protein
LKQKEINRSSPDLDIDIKKTIKIAAIMIVSILIGFYTNIIQPTNNSLIYNKLIDEDVEGLVNKQL